jgi:hypothetical protein
MTGRKDDQGKRRYSLIPPGALGLVADVLTWGADHYGAENWRQVDKAQERYTDAAMRHLEAFRAGEWLDQKTKLPHLAHLVCDALFLLELRAAEQVPAVSKTIPSPPNLVIDREGFLGPKQKTY